MNSTLFRISPFLLILLGLIILFMTQFTPVAGICFLLGIVMIIERTWPEKWEIKENK